jgi:hypothetical protein
MIIQKMLGTGPSGVSIICGVPVTVVSPKLKEHESELHEPPPPPPPPPPSPAK